MTVIPENIATWKDTQKVRAEKKCAARCKIFNGFNSEKFKTTSRHSTRNNL